MVKIRKVGPKVSLLACSYHTFTRLQSHAIRETRTLVSYLSTPVRYDFNRNTISFQCRVLADIMSGVHGGYHQRLIPP